MSEYTYGQACWNYAEDQGLGAMIDTLDQYGVESWLFQSGGFCMILVVPMRDGDRFVGEYGITYDGDVWIVVWYPGGIASAEELEDEDNVRELPHTNAVLRALTGVDHISELTAYASHEYGRGVTW